jgi:hypothetical protein
MFLGCSGCTKYGVYKSSCNFPHQYPKILLELNSNGTFLYILPIAQDTISGTWEKKSNKKYALISDVFKQNTLVIGNDTLHGNIYKQTNNLNIDIIKVKGRRAFFVDSIGRYNRKCVLKKK